MSNIVRCDQFINKQKQLMFKFVHKSEVQDAARLFL